MSHFKEIQAELLKAKEKIQSELGVEDLHERADRAAASLTTAKRKRAELPTEELRRSSRVQNLPAVSYTDMKVWEPPQKRARTAGDDDGSGDDEGGGAAASARASRAVAARSEAAPGSLRTLKADILRMSAEFLGKEVPFHLGGSGAQAKRAVMNTACADRSKAPTFSKMSGIQEWANAIFLFVNVSPDGSNTFLDGGRQITWFAQDRQTLASAQVQRLIHHATGTEYPLPADKEKALIQRMKTAGGAFSAPPPTTTTDDDGGSGASSASGASAADDGAAAGSSGSSSGSGASSSASSMPPADPSDPPKPPPSAWLAPCSVALICRIDSMPYVWCGELEFIRFVPGTHPLQFVWRLKDFDRLASDPASLFDAVVTASGSSLARAAAGGAGTGGGGGRGRGGAAAGAASGTS